MGLHKMDMVDSLTFLFFFLCIEGRKLKYAYYSKTLLPLKFYELDSASWIHSYATENLEIRKGELYAIWLFLLASVTKCTRGAGGETHAHSGLLLWEGMAS